ncbi:cupin domain-containing protein [Nannizzia gypsea CBS 118893]|uniref:Cupin domain-containing protein n=1 Tax=Arthroderma gypseum (strain ATCC MYA-4604 / CBS 118893) TaxID=535722 RepID=E4USP8_ARTGP|nr:cupin domain-containing protein [Nannizzia gypsea CBS 118893]EFR00563.1 cupin domain-containing protein [Nannizzia gypsea CBS 118893]
MVRPLEELQVTERQIPAWGNFPNTSIQSKPLLIYQSVFDNSATSETVSEHLEAVGAVVPQWTYSMYPANHFHSNTHEVLSVVTGQAKLCFGHEENPDRFETTVSKGDVIVVPAGVGHCLLEDTRGDFAMVGAYPPGIQWNMCYGEEEVGKEKPIIQSVGWFDRDPIYGDSGPVLAV